MTTDPDVTRAVRSWLDEDADRLPEWVLDAVLEMVPATPQRRPWWPPRRLIDMTSKVQIAAGVAAIVLVAVVGLQLLPAAGGTGGPTATATPAPTATPTASPSPSIAAVAVGRPLDPGTYQVGAPFPAPFTLAVPAGWRGSTITGGEATFEGPAFLGVFKVDAVFPDPCKTAGTSPVPVSTADEAVQAFGAMEGFTSTPAASDSIGGNPASRFEVSNSIDTSTAGCTGDLMLPLFTSPGKPEGNATNGGTTATVWVVDAATGPMLVWLDSYDAADVAALEQMVRSITFE
jgi:hypothetical protein